MFCSIPEVLTYIIIFISLGTLTGIISMLLGNTILGALYPTHFTSVSNAVLIGTLGSSILSTGLTLLLGSAVWFFLETDDVNLLNAIISGFFTKIAFLFILFPIGCAAASGAISCAILKAVRYWSVYGEKEIEMGYAALAGSVGCAIIVGFFVVVLSLYGWIYLCRKAWKSEQVQV
ncbi:hypothetical protein BDQ17DRAFT_1429721 [Cyathus striatus]|nr:hypothetical protein BDQ17DRAFT_1429721 [Cyathus striatus]